LGTTAATGATAGTLQNGQTPAPGPKDLGHPANDEGPCTVTANSYPLTVGGEWAQDGTACHHFARGAVADIRIWDTQLSQASVQEVFAEGMPQIPAVSTWGVVVLLLLLTSAGTIVLARGRVPAR